MTHLAVIVFTRACHEENGKKHSRQLLDGAGK